MGDKEIGVSKKRSIFFTCIFDGTDKHAPHEILLAARTAFSLNRICARFYGDFASYLLRQKLAINDILFLCNSIS